MQKKAAHLEHIRVGRGHLDHLGGGHEGNEQQKQTHDQESFYKKSRRLAPVAWSVGRDSDAQREPVEALSSGAVT
jgi:hypothetical protein